MTTDNSTLKEIHELAEVALCDINDVIEYGSITLDEDLEALGWIRDTLREILQKACDALDRLDKAVAREAVLQAVVDNFCEQHECQENMEECGRRGSYPHKFPEWEQAWEQAFAVRYGASQVAQELLKKIDECAESLQTILDEATSDFDRDIIVTECRTALSV